MNHDEFSDRGEKTRIFSFNHTLNQTISQITFTFGQAREIHKEGNSIVNCE